MNQANDSTIVLFLVFMLIIVGFTHSPKTPIHNKGIVQFEQQYIQPIQTITHPLQQNANNQNIQEPIVDEKVQEVTDFSKQFYLPEKQNDGISLEKPDIDIRDVSIDNWRNEKNNKNQNQVLSDLREYQQNLNEGEQNEFKKISVDEHRKQSIQEWQQRVKQHTQNAAQSL